MVRHYLPDDPIKYFYFVTPLLLWYPFLTVKNLKPKVDKKATLRKKKDAYHRSLNVFRASVVFTQNL